MTQKTTFILAKQYVGRINFDACGNVVYSHAVMYNVLYEL